MRTVLKNLVASRSGAAAAEYALILAVVAIGTLTAFGVLNDAIIARVSNAASLLAP